MCETKDIKITDEAKKLLNDRDRIFNYMDTNFVKYDPVKFYEYIFPNPQSTGELNFDYSKPNPLFLFRDQDTDKFKRRIFFKDTWEQDFIDFIECNHWAICSGLSYIGKVNTLDKAEHMNALIFDLDSVGYNEFWNFIRRIDLRPDQLRSIPYPTFLVMSGTGFHIYYVFEEPIKLYPYTKIQLKRLKDSLTRRIWDHMGTTKLKHPQIQSINQAFRIVGSINGKYGTEVIGFKVGDKVTLDYINQYVPDEYKVDLTQRWPKKKHSLEEAKELYPDWYEREVLKSPNAIKKTKWTTHRGLYDWWKTKVHEITGGHRYFYMMFLSVYAYKCDIDKEELLKDLQQAFLILRDVPHTNILVQDDVYSALNSYAPGSQLYSIENVEKLTAVRIERNKRNFRDQKQHLEIARLTQKVVDPDEKWRNLDGRPKGTTSERLILDFVNNNPNTNVKEISQALNLTEETVKKYLPEDKALSKTDHIKMQVFDLLYEDPNTKAKDLMDLFGIAKSTAYKYIKEHRESL